MSDQPDEAVGKAIGQIPSGIFILTSRDDGRQTGMLASWVQQVSFDPPMVSVAIARGRPVLALVNGSRCFGLCQIPKGDKVLMRRFASGVGIDDDPFLGLNMVPKTKLDIPVLADALSYLECEVAHHVNTGADHDLFVGRIVGGVYLGGEPQVHIRKNGFQY